jgi:hypothetical protein
MDSQVWAALIGGSCAVLAALVGVWFNRQHKSPPVPSRSADASGKEKNLNPTLEPLREALGQMIYRLREIEMIAQAHSWKRIVATADRQACRPHGW